MECTRNMGWHVNLWPMGEPEKLITGIRFGYYDLATQKPEGMDELLARWEKLRMKNTEIIAMTNRFFSPFVLLVDTNMGKEALLVLATLSQLMSAKMDKPILHVKGWVSVRIAIAVARSYSRVLRIARAPNTFMTRVLD